MSSPAPRRALVAIDGPAGAGKSTAARRIAARLGYALLDTGAIYRTLAWEARRRGLSWDDEAAIADAARSLPIRFSMENGVNRVFLGDEEVTTEIRKPEISEGASRISAHPGVRSALLDVQRRLGERGGVVVEGRDIGTVVFPRAEVKFFLVASGSERARRRVAELQAAGARVDPAETAREMAERDLRDSTRAVAPLRKADDAIEIDTSDLRPDEVVERMLAAVRGRSKI